jgi:hypothetical protein
LPLIWVVFGLKSNDLMEEFFSGTPHRMSQNSLQVFLPYAQILAIYHFGGGPWISEKVAE